MGIIEFSMKTHSIKDITGEFTKLNNCILHNRIPKILEVVAGKRKEKHYTANCDSPDCGKISMDKNQIVTIWNKFNPKTKNMSQVTEIKQLRKDTDSLIQRIKDLPSSRETSLSITKLQEGVMWLGMELKRLGELNPYPSSKDPNTGEVIEPTADNLKF